MQKVILLGELSQFGKEWNVECRDISSIIRLISCQTPGFKKFLVDAENAGLDLEIVSGNQILTHPAELFVSLDDKDIVMTLCPSGGKSKFLRFVTAVILISLGQIEALGPLANVFTAMGVNMGLSVIAEILAPGPETDNRQLDEDPGDRIFNGPVNISKNGVPIPVLYGELVVGGAAISAEFQMVDASESTIPLQASIQDEFVQLY